MKERVVVFIDGPNIFYAIRDLNIKIDYRRLVNFLVKDRKLVEARYYTSMPREEDVQSSEWESYMRQKKFLKKLESQGIKVIVTTLKKLPSGGYEEKGLDIILSTDMLKLSKKYDTGILVSGDGDFVNVVKEIKQIGKRIENAAFIKTSSYQLRNACDRYIPLDDYTNRFIRKTVAKEISLWKRMLNSVVNFWKRI